MKHKLLVFSSAGDSAVAEWDVENQTEVAHAKGVFDAAVADGWAAVAPTVGEKDETTEATPVRTFNPTLEETYLLRPIAGG